MQVQVARPRQKYIPLPRIGKDPPKEFRVFGWGKNPTSKGMLTLTPEGAQSIIEKYERRGNALSFDLEHSQRDKQVRPQDKKSAGQHRLELRDDGIWATDIQWVPRIAEEIRNGEWCWFSPTVWHTPDGVITDIENIALTNDPATYHAQPLLLSRRFQRTKEALSVISDEPMKLLSDMLTGAEMLMTAAQAGLQSTDARIQGLAQRAIDMLPALTTDLQTLSEELDPDGTYEGTEDYSALSSLKKGCAELTGKAKIPEMLGTLRAWKQNQAATLAKLSRAERDEVAALVDKGIAEHKIPPGERSLFVTLSKAEVRAHLDTALPLVPDVTEPPKEAPLQMTALSRTNPLPQEVQNDAAEILRRATLTHTLA